MEGAPVDDLWLDEDQQRSWRAYLLGSTLLGDRLEQDMRTAHRISMTEYEIMVRLSESRGSMRMAQLAASLAHSRSRVTHTVARMEEVGLVTRCASPEDGRGIVCSLTEAGWDRLREVAPTHVRSVRDHLVDLVSAEDLAALGRVMDAVCDHLVPARPALELRQDP